MVIRKEGPNLPIEYPIFFGRESICIVTVASKPAIELAVSEETFQQCIFVWNYLHYPAYS
jgi:hypothetical protein